MATSRPSRIVEATPRISANDIANGTIAVVDRAGVMTSVRARVEYMEQRPFGGVRPLAICPVCDRRVRYLYAVEGRAVCRACGNLDYLSQHENKLDRLGRQSIELRQRLSPDGMIHNSLLTRPRGMHKSTFNRLRDRLWDIEYQRIAELRRRWPEVFND